MTHSPTTSPTSNQSALELLERLTANIPGAGDISNPDWSDCFQSWKAYIPVELRTHWSELTLESKLLGVLLGEELVGKENLD